jgi:hypothetical protein
LVFLSPIDGLQSLLPLRHGIISSGREGMTPHQPLYAQPQAPDDPIPLDALEEILRAAGPKATDRGIKGRDQYLIQSNHKEGHLLCDLIPHCCPSVP